MTKQNYDHEVVRGLLYNLLGMLGRAFNPIFFIVVGRQYGADALGVYMLAYVFIEMLKKLAVGGFNEAIMIFTARHLARDDGEEDAYRALANCIVFWAIFGTVAAAGIYMGATRLLPMYSADRVQSLLRLMTAGMFTQAMAVLLVAATKARVEMKWDALMGGFIRPFGFFFFAVLFSFAGLGFDGLGYGYSVTGVVMLIVALFIFFRSFSLKKLLRAFRHFRFMRELLAFVIPQNLNLTFTDVIAGFDVMMLGFFEVPPALIGYYGIASQIVLNIEQMRIAFARVYTPVIARLHGRGLLEEMNLSFNKVSRWAMLIAFPVGFLVIFFRRELLRLFHPAFGVPFVLPVTDLIPDALIQALQLGYLGDMGVTGFMIILTLVPLLSCGCGMAGEVILAVGLSRWSLLNSAFVAGLCVFFAALLIPGYGLFGVALAAAFAAVAIRTIQLLESWFLVGVRFRVKMVYKPYLAGLISGVLLFFSDLIPGDETGFRLIAIAITLCVYFIVLKWLGFEEGDTRVLMLWKKSGNSGGAAS